MDKEELRAKVTEALMKKGTDNVTSAADITFSDKVPTSYCKNCGAAWQEDYPDCFGCTPQEVIDAKNKLVDSRVDAARLFDEIIADQKEEFIKEQMKDDIANYKELYNKFKPESYAKI
jgi:hypothetical protein